MKALTKTTPTRRYALVRPVQLDLDSFARTARLHPDLVRRLVALDLLDAERDMTGGLWFSPSQLTVVGRIQRLRAGFALNYAALGLVCDLLDRIEGLERSLRRRSRRTGG
ncbi:MAG TPA: chaperone modulator CbpM [Actinomadura sp.]|jgi:hypothetical protein|nr:chaperone modulator CbpM [Actinomadura sp.]